MHIFVFMYTELVYEQVYSMNLLFSESVTVQSGYLQFRLAYLLLCSSRKPIFDLYIQYFVSK